MFNKETLEPEVNSSRSSNELWKIYLRIVGSASSADFSAQTPTPECSEPNLVELQDLSGGYKVLLSRRFKTMTVVRFLVSKLVWDPDESLHLDEHIVLQELWFRMWEKLEEDPVFSNKWKKVFTLNHWFIKELGNLTDFPYKLNFKSLKEREMLGSELQGLVFGAHAYFGLKKTFLQLKPWTIRLNRHLRPTRPVSQRRIGVGYRDRGALKNSAKDGSPHWREVFPCLVQDWEEPPGNKSLFDDIRKHPFLPEEDRS